MIVEGSIQYPFQICSIYPTSSKPLYAHNVGHRKPMIICLSKRGLSCILIQTVLCSCRSNASTNIPSLWTVEPKHPPSCFRLEISAIKHFVHQNHDCVCHRFWVGSATRGLHPCLYMKWMCTWRSSRHHCQERQQ